MKIPYIKIYTADILAYTEFLTPQQIGEAVKGVCQIGFVNQTTYQPKTEMEREFFNTLLQWKEECKTSLQKRKQAGRKNIAVRWHKKQVSDGSNGMHTETDTETNTETETETDTYIYTARAKTPAQSTQASSSPKFPNILTEPHKTARDVCESFSSSSQTAAVKEAQTRAPNALEQFAARVMERFEPHLTTDEQKQIWFKRNARCLSDIFKFCGRESEMALNTIGACRERLKNANLQGGYEAVARNLPQYYQTALEQAREANGYPTYTNNANFAQSADLAQQLQTQQVKQAQDEAYAAIVAHAKARGKHIPTRDEVFS